MKPVFLCLLLALGHASAQEAAQPAEFARAGVLSFGRGQTLALQDDGCTLSKPEWQTVVDGVPKVRVTYDAVGGGAQACHAAEGAVTLFIFNSHP